MVDLPLVLHIGYHKTGTTFLQTKVFRRHPQIFYLGRPWVNDQVGSFFREFAFTHDLVFEPQRFVEGFRRVVDRAFEELEHRGSSDAWKVILVSSESLHTGPEWFGMTTFNMAKRLENVFSPCKIVIGIRNQKEYIVSNYKEYVLHGGKIGFKQFLYNSFACNYCLLPKLEFDRVVSLYQAMFGEEMVHVYLQERLKSSPFDELRDLMRFLGVDTSVEFEQGIVYGGMSRVFVECVRLMNRLVAGDFNEQYCHVGIPNKWSGVERARRRCIRVLRAVERRFLPKRSTSRYLGRTDTDYIDRRFRESNRRLSEMLNSQIRGLGYFY